MTFDPHTDPETGVLRNRLGITDADRLRAAEAGLSLAALAELQFRTIPGAYDLDHLCAFHREIFGDIYPWAGEIRVVGIAKSDPFCLPQCCAEAGVRPDRRTRWLLVERLGSGLGSLWTNFHR